MRALNQFIWLVALLSLCLAIRCAISQHSYSGAGSPPLYGDFEAQRHWMEITVNLPIQDWYKNTTNNDLMYWGLDYPPLTAYHSWIMGKLAKQVLPELVEIHKSRGIENSTVKLFMRNSVIIADLLFFIPAVFFVVKSIYPKRSQSERRDAIIFLLLIPSLVLIDHGHFQYNCVSLGLLLWAIAFYCRNKMLLSSLAFTCSFCYKQMSLYYAPGFLFAMLGQSIHSHSGQKIALDIAKKGIVVVSTIIVCLVPFLSSPSSVESLRHILHRVFPFARGLYEDKVANFWCVSNVLYKWSAKYDQTTLVKLCTLVTIVFLIPVGYLNLRFAVYRSRVSFLLTLTCSSLAFFLFSFQVHEKSILLPLIPACLLCLHDPTFARYFSQIATFSMLCLLRKDGLLLPSIAIAVLGEIVSKYLPKKRHQLRREYILQTCFKLSSAISILIMLAFNFLPSSTRFPHLEDIAIASFSALHFFGFYLLALLENLRIARLEKSQIKSD